MNYIFCLVFIQAAASALSNYDIEPDTKHLLIKFFGSLGTGMLSLVKICTGSLDWGPVIDVLGKSGPLYFSVFLFYIAFETLAVLNVVLGLFVDTALKSAEVDHAETLKCAAEEQAQLTSDVCEILRSYEMSSDDMISSVELGRSLKFPEMQAFLEYVGVDNDEVMQLHKVLGHQHSGSVSIEDFVKGCFRVGRPAKSIDSMRLSDQLFEMQIVLETIAGNTARSHAILEPASRGWDEAYGRK